MATTMAPALQPEAPTPYSRMTRDGRRLWYRLQVIQEPERARACGSGPKSTTDRRPVDPPPVCSLRIFEGESIETGTDITFSHNANLFLFCQLEAARPVAHGRVNTPAATLPPVLTGSPVSGMAYLDRPEAAGYFLFPDVSVRHEGRYRFVFALFEQTKEENNLPPEDDGEEGFLNITQVSSSPFSVHSAKKFPGLSESTTLSRIISEQGCRVRIRRDVRMRRRDNKPSSTNDYEQKEEYQRRQRTQTPEIKPDIYRHRSLSNSSMDRTPYDPNYHRRGSMSEYHQGVAPPPHFSPAPSTPTHMGSHLQFGHAPQHTAPPPPPPHQQPQSQYPPPSPIAPHPSQHAAPSPQAMVPQPQQLRHVQQQPRQPLPPPSRTYVQTPPPMSEYASKQKVPAASGPSFTSSGPETSGSAATPRQRPAPARIETCVLPPIQDRSVIESPRDRLSISDLCEPKSRHGNPSLLPPINSQITPQLVVDDEEPRPVAREGKKRAFEDSFNDAGNHQRLNNGRRQEDPHMRDNSLLPGHDEPVGTSQILVRGANGRLRTWEL